MADAPTIHEQLATLKEELALARSISGGGHEPEYRYMADPPGLPVIQAYLQEWEAQLSPGQILPLFRVELPPLAPDGPPLVEVLSRPLGLPMRGKWKDSFFAKERLGGALRTRQIELTILTNAHHLTSRAHSIEWLVCFFREHLESAPLLLVGEEKALDDLLLWKATAWVVRRWSRIRLPGEPKASHRDSLDLLRRLGMQSDSPTSEE